MAIGNSNRVVIDVPLDLKRRLHAALAADGISLRHWFVEAAERYLTRYEAGQRDLPMVAEPREDWGTR
jgi:hypothetical protein